MEEHNAQKSRDSDRTGRGWKEIVTLKEFWQLYEARAVPSTTWRKYEHVPESEILLLDFIWVPRLENTFILIHWEFVTTDAGNLCALRDGLPVSC